MNWVERYERKSILYRFYPIRKALILKNIPSQGLVLELGSGPGVFPELRGRVIALDANRSVLSQGTYPRVCGLNESLPFKDEAFDVVIAAGTLEYSLLPEALHEAHRVLKKEGLLFGSFPNRLSVRRVWDKEVYLPVSSCIKAALAKGPGRPVRWHPTAPEVRELLAGTGFDVRRVIFFDMNPLPRPAERLCKNLARWLCEMLEPHAHPLIANQFLVIASKRELERDLPQALDYAREQR
ncbi:MAG: class I SAM-dependent methyltransferase [candidate division WOR-3 bacterium]